jgi:hypothetical protein
VEWESLKGGEEMQVDMKSPRICAYTTRKGNSLWMIALGVLFIFNIEVDAQEWDMDFSSGVFNYQGELRSERFTWKGMRAAWSAGLRRRIDETTSLSLKCSGSTLTGRDADNPSYLTRRRNLHFETRLLECSLNGLRYINVHHEGYIKPFISAGLALYYVDPFTYDRQGRRHYLYGMSLEGQGLAEYPQVKLPRKVNLSVPIGAGIAFRLSGSLSVEIEMQTRKTFSDQIDGVSGSYPREDILKQARGLSAVELSYRANELAGEDPDFPPEGTMRGNPKTMDWYYGAMLRLVWHGLGSHQDYPPQRKLFRPRGWPYRL